MLFNRILVLLSYGDSYQLPTSCVGQLQEQTPSAMPPRAHTCKPNSTALRAAKVEPNVSLNFNSSQLTSFKPPVLHHSTTTGNRVTLSMNESCIYIGLGFGLWRYPLGFQLLFLPYFLRILFDIASTCQLSNVGLPRDLQDRRETLPTAAAVN